MQCKPMTVWFSLLANIKLLESEYLSIINLYSVFTKQGTMVCILPILWILLLVRASDGENWEAGGFNSEDGEIADTFKMNNHGRPLSNPERHFRRSEREIDRQDLSPRNAKVEVGINNHHDVPSKNDQKFFHMNNHGRRLSNPETYFGTPTNTP